MCNEEEELASLHKKLDSLLEHRKVSIRDIRVSLVGVFMSLLAIGAPSAAVVANHYKIQEHLANTRVHAESQKAERLGGVAYSGDVAQKERQVFFALKALHCGAVQNATQAICSSAYPDGPFPEFLLGKAWGAQLDDSARTVPSAGTSSGPSGGK